MNKASFSKVWSFFAILTLYNSVNMYLAIQKSPLLLPFPDFSKLTPSVNALTSIIIFLVTYFFLSKLTLGYIIDYNLSSKKWYEKIPIPFGLEVINYEQTIIRFLQKISLAFFFILPIILQIHSFSKLLASKIYVKNSKTPCEVWSNGMEENLFQIPNIFKATFFIGGCNKGEWVTYFPFFQTWILIILYLFMFYLLVKLLLRIFKTNLNN